MDKASAASQKQKENPMKTDTITFTQITAIDKANANLVHAAPDLLEAAKQALQVFIDQGWDDDLKAATMLKSAIVKAERSPE